jgi:hypothetical protein
MFKNFPRSYFQYFSLEILFVLQVVNYTVYPRLWQPGLWQNSIIATDLQSTDRSYGAYNVKAVGL